MTRSYLLGRGVGHSISPFVLNAAAEAIGVDWRYELLDVEPDELPSAFARIRGDDSTGANVTMPYKADATENADRLTGPVERSGATNVLVNEGGLLTAHNTDVVAAVSCLERRAERVTSGAAVVLGAGGAAAAALEAFRSVPPARVTILARNAERAKHFAEQASSWLDLPLAVLPIAEAERALEGATLVVNATSLGMKAGDTMPFDPALLRPGQLFYDFVYGRHGLTTPQQQAIEAGADLCEGAVHNLAQAGPSFELLTRQPAPAAEIRGALVEVLGREPTGWR